MIIINDDDYKHTHIYIDDYYRWFMIIIQIIYIDDYDNDLTIFHL